MVKKITNYINCLEVLSLFGFKISIWNTRNSNLFYILKFKIYRDENYFFIIDILNTKPIWF
jgi:hypothetical protein